MAEGLSQLLYFGIGVFLRRTAALNVVDGVAALRLSLNLLVPAVFVGLQASGGLPAVDASTAATAACLGIGHFAFLWLCAWLCFRGRDLKDRGLSTAVVISASGCLSGAAFAGARSGWPRACISFVGDLPMTAVSLVTSNYLLTQTLRRLRYGSMPSKYKHADGGVYSGEWKGLKKEGIGVYTYPSGSIYSGDWKGNVKDGFGTYRYAGGGAYIGQFVGGVPSGLGVRVFRDGKTKVGRWGAGRFEEPVGAGACEPCVEMGLQRASLAKTFSKDRAKPTMQVVLANALPFLFALLVAYPRKFYGFEWLHRGLGKLVTVEVASVIFRILEPLTFVALGIIATPLAETDAKTSEDSIRLVSLRCLFSGAYASIVLWVLHAVSLQRVIAGTLASTLGPIPVLLLSAGQIDKDATNLVGNAVMLSVPLSVSISCLGRVLYGSMGAASAAAWILCASAAPFAVCGFMDFQRGRREDSIKRTPATSARAAQRSHPRAVIPQRSLGRTLGHSLVRSMSAKRATRVGASVGRHVQGVKMGRPRLSVL